MKPELELETPRKVELLEVIHTEAVRGKGTNENPVRVVHQYWDKEGNLLAEKDDYWIKKEPPRTEMTPTQ